MINGYIDVNTRTGTLDANINSCAKETIEFNVSFDAGLTVAILSVEGKTLALSTIEEATQNSVTINTMTVQAYEHTHELGAGQSLPIVIAIGDSNHLQALVTGRMQFNSLYDKAPPEDLAPQYPTSEELKALLAEMQSASNSAAQSATAAGKSAEEAGESASSAASDRATAVNAATSAQAYAEVATAAQALSSTSAAEASTSAANAASSADSARDAASSAMSDANSAAGSAAKAAASADSAASALTASTNAASRAEVAAEKAREADISAANSATAASQSATSAAQEAAENVTVLLQGKLDAAEAAASAARNSAAEAKDAATSANNNATYAQTASTTAQNAATAANNSAATADEHNRAAQSAAESARSSENAASDSAATASSHATTAQNAATTANNSANAAKQNETAAASSATSASASATAANASANAASSSATEAAKSAAASASSASAAKQSEAELADAIATAESLDGRIAKIETGKNLGFLASGGFQAYTQLNAGDGSFKVLKDLPNVKKVAMKAYDDSVAWGCFDDGNHAYVYSGQYKYGPHILFIFDSGLNAVAGPINNGFDSRGVNISMVPSKAYYHAENERLYGVEGLYNSKLLFGCMSKDGALLKRVSTSIPSNGGSTNSTGCVVYNKRSGHIVVFYVFDHYDGANKTLWYQAFDLDLNPVLNEDGSERIYSRLNEIKETWHSVIFSVKYIEDVAFLLENGGAKANGRIFTLDENDDLCVLHEGIVQADEDGNMLCETREVTNEDGTTSVEYVLDAPERNKMVRPILADGGEYHFNVAINEEARPKMTAAGASRRNPVFSYLSGFYFMNDGVDVYVVLKNGEIVDTVTMPGNWTSGKHGKPSTKASGDRSVNFTKSSQTLYCISGRNVDGRFTPSLVYDTSTGNELSSWRRMTKNNFIWEVGNLLWPCIPYASPKPEVYVQASPFKANWLLFGNLWYTNIDMIKDHKLTYI